MDFLQWLYGMKPDSLLKIPRSWDPLQGSEYFIIFTRETQIMLQNHHKEESRMYPTLERNSQEEKRHPK